jgi:hypothetical protein
VEQQVVVTDGWNNKLLLPKCLEQLRVAHLVKDVLTFINQKFINILQRVRTPKFKEPVDSTPALELSP